MKIREAIQQNWESLLCKTPCVKSIFQAGNVPDADKGLFRKSFALVWQYFQSQMSDDDNKSRLLMIAPPYRKGELLECVLRLLVASEMSPGDFMTPDEIRAAWKSKTQVMLCLKHNGSVRRYAYTPRDGDVQNGEHSYCYRKNGRYVFNPDEIIVIKAENHRNDHTVPDWYYCKRGRDENLFGECGFLKLKRAIVIVGNKRGEVVKILRDIKIGERSLWDAFSAIELGDDGKIVSQAVGNGMPSIIVVNDYSRLQWYFEDTEGRYDKFHCVICNDSESIKEPGRDGMYDQIVIRSLETVIKKLFDGPADFKSYYRNISETGCVFVWDRFLDADLIDEDLRCKKEITVVRRERQKEVWARLHSKIRSLLNGMPDLDNDKDIQTICRVYKQLHLPKAYLHECMVALESVTKTDVINDVVGDLKTLIEDLSGNESEKFTAIERYLQRDISPDWTVGLLSRCEDRSVMALLDSARAIPRNANKVSEPCLLPGRTVAYRKMSTVAANRYWLFDVPGTAVHWFLYEEERNALDAQNDLLEDLETRHVMTREKRAEILGVDKDLLRLSDRINGVSVKDERQGNDVPAEIPVSPVEGSLEASIKRFMSADIGARVECNNNGSIPNGGGCVRIRFRDGSTANYGRSNVLVIEDGRRLEVEARKLKPNQTVVLVNLEKAREHSENLYGSPDKAAMRWRSVLRDLMKRFSHLDYLVMRINEESRKLGGNRTFSGADLRRYASDSDDAIELPCNSVTRAAVLFQAIGIVGEDSELSDNRYARGLAAVIQDAHSQNRSKGRGYMGALRKAWLGGSDEFSDCFSEKVVIESYEIDEEDILEEE